MPGAAKPAARGAMAASEPTQHFFESQRLRLAYWSWGDPEAPPLILLHGRRDHSRSFDRVAAALCDDYHVVACDLRGHGDSAWATGGYYAMSEHVADLLTLIERFGGRADVVAHSFGARIALYAAGAFPERFHSLAAIEGTVKFAFRGLSRRPLAQPEGLRRWIARARGYEALQPRVYPTLEEARDRMLEVDSRLDAGFALELARYGTRPVEGGHVWKFDAFARGRSYDEQDVDAVRRFWSAIECPVLHILGGESSWSTSPPEPEDERAFRDARWVVVTGAGHWVHHDQLEMTLRELRAFLAEHGGAASGRRSVHLTP